MDSRIQYSTEQIRRIAEEGRILLRSIEERAETVCKISEKTAREQPHVETDALLKSARKHLEEMVNGYRMQIDHLDTAAELYEQCAGEVSVEVEKIMGTGGAVH